MCKKIFGLLVGLLGMVNLCFAGDISFGEAKTAVSGADAQEFEVKDIDGDNKPDLIWRDSAGDLKYSLQVTEILIKEDFNDGSYSDNNPVSCKLQYNTPPEIICESNECYWEGYTTNDSGHSALTTMLYTDNPTNIGSWQFDSRLKSSEDDQYNLIQLSNSGTSNSAVYSIHQSKETDIVFDKILDGTRTNLISKTGFEEDVWYTIKITRNDEGEWKLFVNGSLIGTVVDNSITELPYLRIGRYGNIDNIIVSK